MGLKFNCPNAKCRQRIEVEDALAGTEISCPACAVKVRVPVSHDLRFTCRTAGCGQHLVVDVSEGGRFAKCPSCDKPQRVPGDPPKSILPLPEATANTKLFVAVPGRAGFLFGEWSKKHDFLGFWAERLGPVWAVVTGVCFGIVALVLMVTGAEDGPLWQQKDVIIGVSTRTILRVGGCLHLVLAAYMVFSRNWVNLGALAIWLGLNYTVYRIGLLWLEGKPTSIIIQCIGDVIRAKPETLGMVWMIIIAFLMVGGAASLFVGWLATRRHVLVSKITPKLP